MNQLGVPIDDLRIPSAAAVGIVIRKVMSGELSNKGAKLAFASLVAKWQQLPDHIDATIDAAYNEIIARLDLAQSNDSGALDAIVNEVLAANPKNVAEYKAGNAKALNALVGQIMKGSKGKANPQQVNDLLRQKLG